MMTQPEDFLIVLLIAELNTSGTPSPDNAEHSTYLKAPISLATAAPYYSVKSFVNDYSTTVIQ